MTVLSDGETILLVDGDPNQIHLPGLHANVPLAASNGGFIPATWRTRCGQRGKTFTFRPAYFGGRSVCGGCDSA